MVTQKIYKVYKILIIKLSDNSTNCFEIVSIILFVILRKITAVISLFCTNIMQLVFCAILPMASQDTILASDYPIYAPKQAKNGLKSLIGLRILRILPYEIRISPLKKLQKWRMCNFALKIIP